MNQLLRRVAKDLRYRPLPSLISGRFHIESFDSVVDSVTSWLAGQLPYRIAFEGPEGQFQGLAVVKYEILDLTFSVDHIDWNHDEVLGVPLLKELGFVVSPEDLDRAENSGMDDPTCLAELSEDIGKNQTLLRLLLEKRPGRAKELEYIKQIVLSGRFQEILQASEAGEEHFRRVVDSCFPDDFTISDACLTNAEFVWFHKHFYL